MVKHLNSVHLVGALVDAIKSGSTRNGGEWCSFRLRTAPERGGGNGIMHNIKSFDLRAIDAIRGAKPGAELDVKGRISRRKWEKNDGTVEWITEIVAHNMDFATAVPPADDGTSPPMDDDDEVPF